MNPFSLRFFILLIGILFITKSGYGVVSYDEGRRQINGIQLLRDKDNPNEYYYLPQYPRISSKDDGSLELLCIKYVGDGDPAANGGIFHALIEFSLPPEVIQELEKELQKEFANAKIVGMVPMQQVMEDGEKGLSRFKVISSTLNNIDGENSFTQSLITSGHAPLIPGSKAAIAARLSQEGATLLFESLQSPTSDVSVTLTGYYEAAVKGYNAIVTAEMSTIYTHYSRVLSFQEDYTKRQLRKISDQLIQDQVLNVEVFDRSEGLGIDTDDMAGLLDLVTEKLIELMFDSKEGWAQRPEAEVAVEQGQIQGRQERGWFSQVFGGARNEKYVSDNQFVLKRREDIRVNKFYLNLSKSTTIKVPLYASGNLGGIYTDADPDARYFKTVNLDDPDFQQREVHFQVDGAYAESFSDILNFVTVSFKKHYGEDQNDVTRDLIFNREELEKGVDAQSVVYPRLGIESDEWLDYEYRLSWSLKGSEVTLRFPRGNDNWLKAKDPAISLSPPFKKRVVEIDADRSFFKDAEIKTATVRFFAILNGEAQAQKSVILREGDAESNQSVAIYHDENEPSIYQVTWYSKNGKVQEDPQPIPDDNYLFLIPPSE